MKITDLQIFQAVAKYKNVTKAAVHLNYVQSHVTNRILKLENKLNTTLFHRSNRGVHLTDDGEVLLDYAEKILILVQEAEETFSDSSHLTGPLTIGATDITTAVHLPAILADFHKQHPDVNLHLTTGTTEQLVHDVLRYQIDGAFITDPIHHANIRQEVLLEEELVLVTKKDATAMTSFKDLAPFLVFRPGCSYRAKLEHWLREEGVFQARKIEFGTVEGMIGCVKAGLGTALVSRRMAEQLNEKEIHAFSPPDRYQMVTTLFIQHKKKRQSHKLDTFLQITKTLMEGRKLIEEGS